MSAEFATLAADPSRVGDVEPELIPGLIGEAETLKAVLWARLQAARLEATNSATRTQDAQSSDRLLTAGEAAELLGVDRRWIYRKADELPFTRRLSANTLRFSERGLERWKEARR